MTSHIATASASTMTLLTHGKVTATTQAPTSSSTTMSSPANPPPSRARLLFNSDGSVKLMGDLTQFPGIGADKNSHTLVPTVGPDGKMTMLLTPSDGRGKTFILNPTNGGSLPSPNVIVTPNTLVMGNKSANTLPSTSMYMPKILPTPTQVASKFPQAQLILSGEQLKVASKSPQISLLSTFKSAPVPTTRADEFVTHMRIDPSGSVTSTVRIPCSSSHNSTSTAASVTQSAPGTLPGATAVLKHLAEKVSTIKKEPEENTSHSDAAGPRSSHPGGPESKLTNGKDLPCKFTNNQWTRLNSVLPTSAPSTVVVPNQGQTGVGHKLVSTSTFPQSIPRRYMIVPKTTSGAMAPPPDRPQPAGNTTDVFPITSTVTSSSTMTSSAVPTMMFPHNYAASLSDKRPSMAPTISTNITLPPPQPYPFLGTAPRKVVYPMNYDPVKIAPSVKPTPTPTVVKLLSPSPKDVCDKESLTDGPEKYLDAKTGCLTSDPLQQGPADPDDGVLSIKIDSVFSLAVKEEKPVKTKKKRLRSRTRKCTSGDKDEAESPKKPEVVIKQEAGVESEVKPSASEPEIVTCPPSYVVLEQLSQRQIENPKRHIIKCSNYCRVRTLNFLCTLGLVNCEPTVHIRKCASNCESSENVNPKRMEVQKSKQKQLSQCDSSLDTKPTTREEASGPEKLSSDGRDVSKVSAGRDVSKVSAGRDVSKASAGRDVSKASAGRDVSKASAGRDVSKASAGRDVSKVSAGRDVSKASAGRDVSKVRKVEKPTNPKMIQTVIKFTKIDKEGNKESSPKSETVPASATASSAPPPTLASITAAVPPPAKIPVSCGPAISQSVNTSALPSLNSLPFRPLLNVAKGNVVPGKSTLRLPCTIASKVPGFLDTSNANKKQYYLFTVNGQNVLVPISNDVMKPTAYMLKGNTLSALSNTTSVTTNTPTVSTAAGGPGNNLLVQRLTTALQSQALKRKTDTVPQHTPPSKASKLTEEKVDTVKPTPDQPAGIRIKPEPVTHGYGDEKPLESTPRKKARKQEVKIKQEPVDTEWREVWSTSAVPVEHPDNAPTLKKQSPTSTTVSTDGSASTPGGSRSEDTMPTLPMMQLPSTKDRAHKMAAHNDRVERLKAVLRQKEKEIEDLKKKRVEDDFYGVDDKECDTHRTLEDVEHVHTVKTESVSR
ncbi:mucin-3A-like [Haliotis cracherodii]|uniref:mucin-3A-like n=1 Tax=Haliotis cracherodii TaxID=6455 RepID=UPI0039EA53DB